MRIKSFLLLTAGFLAVFIGITVFLERDAVANKSEAPVDTEAPEESAPPAEAAAILPESFMLEVPFIVQAPQGDWSPPFNHNCEEASILMIHYYLQGKPAPLPAKAAEEMLAMVAFEKEKYGYHEDTAAGQTGVLIEDYFGYEAEVRFNVTNEDIKRELVKGNPVIVPTNGQLLQNPYFTPPGPLYHMLVITGYTPEGFITNDPGTKRGANLSYTYAIMEDANQDWELLDWDTGGENMRSAMIVMKKK